MYHVHNYLKLKVLAAIHEITENGGFADRNSIAEKTGDKKTNVANAIDGYKRWGYITRKKYRSPVDRCRYHYKVSEMGLRILDDLYNRFKNNQSLNLRRAPEPMTDYIRGMEEDEYLKQLRERRQQEKIDSVMDIADKIAMASCKKVVFEDESMNEDIESLKANLQGLLRECIPVVST